MQRLVLTLLVAVSGAGFATIASAATQEVAFTSDKDTYIFPTDQVAKVTVSNLDPCAGQQVEVGFASGGGLMPETRVTAVVSATGTLSVDVLIPRSAYFEARIAVKATCLPGGGARSTFEVLLLHQDPAHTPEPSQPGIVTPPAPGPPNTGNGTASASGDSSAAVFLVLAGITTSMCLFTWRSGASRRPK